MAVVQAHHTHKTFYSIWSDAKDRGTELTYPCAVWDSWRTWIEEDAAGALNRSVAVRLLIVTAVATDRTPGDRDAAVEAADQAAEDYILKLRELYPDMAITNVATTTQFDEYTQLETGVILSFTATGGPLCLDDSAFGPVCAAGVVVNSNGTFTLSVPSGGTATLPDVTHTDSDGTPVVLPGMVAMVCTPGDTPVATTVNGVTSDVPDIHVKQGGVDVGTLDPVTGVHTVPVCPPAGNGSAVLRDTGGTLLSTTSVPAEGSVDITAPDGIYTVKDSAGNILFTGPVKSGGTAEHYVGDGIAQAVNSLGANVGAPVPVPAEGRANVLAPDANIKLKDEANNAIGSLQPAPSGITTNITAPSANAQLVDSSGAAIGSPCPILSNDTRTITVADSVITLPNGSTKNVKATQPYTVPATAPLKFSFSPYDQGSDLWTVTADEAGTYDTYTQDGSSGTITYSKNGGAFVALSGTITLAVGDTIQVKRTTITAAGWSRWQRLVTP